MRAASRVSRPPKSGEDRSRAASDYESGREALDQVAHVVRVRDVADLEWPDEDRSVAEELADERLVDLDRLDLPEVHGLGAPVERAVQEIDLLLRHDEVRPLPLPDGPEREEGARGDEDGAEHRGRRV